jgi:CMP-N,N'-diacetyllegionaminic acid synthase
MKRLCTICVRAGSKGVKNKNIRPLRGTPLLVYSIQHALSSNLFDTLAVSSDSSELLDIARSAGVDCCIERPLDLASDTSPKIPAIRHCVEQVERLTGKQFETLVDLDVTSPLRSVADIAAVVELLEGDPGVSNVITAMPARRSPYFNMVELQVDGTVKLAKTAASTIARRQDAPQCFDMNASIYAWRREVLLSQDTLFLPKTRLHVMPEERSWDIDSEVDFAIVEALMALSHEDRV